MMSRLYSNSHTIHEPFKAFRRAASGGCVLQSGRCHASEPGGDGSEPLAGDRQATGNLQRVNHAVKLQGSDADTMSREPSPD